MTDNDPFLNDLQRQVNRAHSDIPGANDAPPDLWNRVRSHIKPHPAEENSDMSSIAASGTSGSLSSPSLKPDSRLRGGFRHYINVAATVVVVATVALAGWFATMQLNQPPSGNPRFAALGMQPDEAGNDVCDVEPLTVDDVILILKDPIGSMIPEVSDPVAEGYPEDWFGRTTITVPDTHLLLSTIYPLDELSVDLPPQDFKEALPVVDEYLDCLQFGTLGQLWQLTDPVTVQFQIAQRLPVLTSEDDARQLLPDILDSPADLNVAQSAPEVTSRSRMRANPDPSLTIYLAAGGFVGFPGYAITPVIISLDAESNEATPTDVYGNLVEDAETEADFSMNVMYGRSTVDGEWYVFEYFYPFNLPGWD